MAVSEVEFKFTWENNNFVKMEKKTDGVNWITVVEVHENMNIAAITESLKNLCKADIASHLETIMNEMAAP